MTYTAQRSAAVNASIRQKFERCPEWFKLSTRQKFDRYYSPEPLNWRELAALLRWAECYVSDEKFLEECGRGLLEDAARTCLALRRCSCREAAEDFAEMAAEYGIGLVRFHVLLQGYDAKLDRWARAMPWNVDLRSIWRAPRDAQDSQAAEHKKRFSPTYRGFK